MRRYSNARGEGKFFTVDFLDAQGGEIRAIAFNDLAEKYDEVLQQGHVYLVSKASLKPKKPGSVSVYSGEQLSGACKIIEPGQYIAIILSGDY